MSESVISTNKYVRVVKDLGGDGHIVQVWVLRINKKTKNGAGDDEYDYMVMPPSCYYASGNIVFNTKLLSEKDGNIIKDEGITGWEDVPRDVQKELIPHIPENSHIVGGNGNMYHKKNHTVSLVTCDE